MTEFISFIYSFTRTDEKTPIGSDHCMKPQRSLEQKWPENHSWTSARIHGCETDGK